MATEESFEFNTSGEVTVGEAEQVSGIAPQAAAAPSSAIPDDATGIERISALIADPEAYLPDIMRLIALEMAKVMKKMTGERDVLDRGMTSMKDLNDQMKAFQILQKTLTDSDMLSKKDFLNMDGPKFRFVFQEMVRLFTESMKEARVDEDLANNVIMQFGDKLKANDEAMRRELNKIESGR